MFAHGCQGGLAAVSRNFRVAFGDESITHVWAEHDAAVGVAQVHAVKRVEYAGHETGAIKDAKLKLDIGVQVHDPADVTSAAEGESAHDRCVDTDQRGRGECDDRVVAPACEQGTKADEHVKRKVVDDASDHGAFAETCGGDAMDVDAVMYFAFRCGRFGA